MITTCRFSLAQHRRDFHASPRPRPEGPPAQLSKTSMPPHWYRFFTGDRQRHQHRVEHSYSKIKGADTRNDSYSFPVTRMLRAPDRRPGRRRPSPWCTILQERPASRSSQGRRRRYLDGDARWPRLPYIAAPATPSLANIVHRPGQRDNEQNAAWRVDSLYHRNLQRPALAGCRPPPLPEDANGFWFDLDTTDTAAW